MRSCLYGAECESKQSVKGMAPKEKNKKCGLDFAYAYFCSFIFLSSFLVNNIFESEYC